MATITDKRIQHSSDNTTTDYFMPDVVAEQEYYAFGALMPGRSVNTAGYRYGFNGKENDNDVGKGTGNQQDYGMRIYDPRIARFLSVDPITTKYPELTPYQFASNSPVVLIDMDGLEGLHNGINKDPNILYAVNEGQYAYPLQSAFNGIGNLWRKAEANMNGEKSYLRTSLVIKKWTDDFGMNTYTQTFQTAERTQTGKGWEGIKESGGDVLDASSLFGYKNGAAIFAKAPGKGQILREIINWSAKSTKTFGHAFLEHGQKRTIVQLADRARKLGHGIGQWANDKRAADFIKSIWGSLKEGENIVDIPKDLGHVVSADKTITTATKATIVKKSADETNLLKTAFPIN